MQGTPGLNSAMQSVKVGRETFTSNTLTSIVFPGATANLTDGVLTLECMQGPPGDNIQGTPGLNSAKQSVKVGSETCASDTLTSVVFPSAAANIADGVLTLEPMQ